MLGRSQFKTSACSIVKINLIMRIPSKTENRYWLFELNESYEFKKPRAERQSGKWLIFDTPETIDSTWLIVSEAVKRGQLGPSAKVSTAKPNPNAADQSTSVICVFTEDYNDRKDVHRVERALRYLGIKNRLVYKLDRDVGKYQHQGHQDLIKEISEAVSE